MKTVSAAKIAAQFNEYLIESREQPVLVTRNGKPVAVLLSVDSQRQADQLAKDPTRSLRSIFQEAHEQLASGEGIPHDQFWREVEKSRSVKKKGGTRGAKRANGK